jgi:hypothetical protein
MHTPNYSRKEHDEYLAQIEARKQERISKLAGIIGRAAAKQDVFKVDETAADYLARLGIDLTKI